MALNNIYDLQTLSKTSVNTSDYFEVANATTKVNKKLIVSSIFPSLATTGTSSEDIFINITNKNQLNFKGIKSGDTGLLTVATASNNIELTVLEAGIDLSLCNNTTSLFSSGVDFTSTITNECPVVNGGTGLSTIAKGAILYADAADSIAATAIGTNGQILVHNSTTGVPAWATLDAGTNLTLDTSVAGVLTLNAGLTTMASNIDMANYDIDLGTGWLSGNGTHEGINIDSDGKVFIGEDTPTAAFVSALNIKGSIEFTNTDAPTIKPTATTSSTAGQPITIKGGGSAGAAAGNLNLGGGDCSGSGAGGSVIITAGRDTSGSSDGTVQLKTYTGASRVAGLTVAAEGQDVTVNTGNLVITEATKGIIHTGSGTVTQATNHSTGVTINATSGVITLAGVALNGAAEADFAVTNSTVQADSVILLTVQSPAAASATDNATLVAQLDEVNSGSFNVRLSNPGAGNVSTNAHKIHFLVINNS